MVKVLEEELAKFGYEGEKKENDSYSIQEAIYFRNIIYNCFLQDVTLLNLEKNIEEPSVIDWPNEPYFWIDENSYIRDIKWSVIQQDFLNYMQDEKYIFFEKLKNFTLLDSIIWTKFKISDTIHDINPPPYYTQIQFYSSRPKNLFWQLLIVKDYFTDEFNEIIREKKYFLILLINSHLKEVQQNKFEDNIISMLMALNLLSEIGYTRFSLRKIVTRQLEEIEGFVSIKKIFLINNIINKEKFTQFFIKIIKIIDLKIIRLLFKIYHLQSNFISLEKDQSFALIVNKLINVII